MKILITGSSGQLGKMLIKTKPLGIDILAFNRVQLDLLNHDECYKKIIDINPDWVINCGAYTHVDEAERNIKKAYKINGYSLEKISKAVKHIGSKLMHFSTDFVFDGSQNYPYEPLQKKNPLNIYGKSKSLGEDLIRDHLNDGLDSIILRTSWLVGPIGDNFALKMLELHQKNEALNVVCDQIGSPTSTFSLSKACWEIIKKHEKFLSENDYFPGIIHFCDAGVASWYDLAYEIGNIGFELGLIKKKAYTIPIKSDDYKSLARRPNYSVLDCSKTYKLIGINPINWRESLFNFLVNLKNKNYLTK